MWLPFNCGTYTDGQVGGVAAHCPVGEVADGLAALERDARVERKMACGQATGRREWCQGRAGGLCNIYNALQTTAIVSPQGSLKRGLRAACRPVQYRP